MADLEPVSRARTRSGLVETFKPQDDVALTVSGGATPSNTSDPVNVEDADALALLVTNGASTSLDILVLASVDGVTFGSEGYHSWNIGANKSKPWPITPGVRKIKVKVDNNDAANATTVTTHLTKYTHD